MIINAHISSRFLRETRYAAASGALPAAAYIAILSFTDSIAAGVAFQCGGRRSGPSNPIDAGDGDGSSTK